MKSSDRLKQTGPTILGLACLGGIIPRAPFGVIIERSTT
jgi:hypothetical protein